MQPYTEEELKWEDPYDGRRAKSKRGPKGPHEECTEEEIREHLRVRGPEIARKLDTIIARENQKWLQMTDDERDRYLDYERNYGMKERRRQQLRYQEKKLKQK